MTFKFIHVVAFCLNYLKMRSLCEFFNHIHKNYLKIWLNGFIHIYLYMAPCGLATGQFSHRL